MPQLKTHIYFGLFTYPLAYLLIALGLMQVKGLHFSVPLDAKTIALGYFVYVIGSDLPDIDSQNAPIHHFLKILASILGVFMILSWTNTILLEKFSGPMMRLIMMSVVMFAGGIISYFLITAILKLKIFDHRKFAHSVSFAVIYGLLLYAGLYKEMENPIFTALLGGTGVLLHLILDAVGDIKHGNKRKALKLW